MADLISTQINLSRDAIREQISDYLKSYLELENVDLTKSSFLTFLVNILSTLTGNLLFYQLSTYREFFLTQAQLSESIFNLSAFLGYNTQEASYATVNVLMTIPWGFPDASNTFTIPSGFKFKTDSEIEFVTYYIVETTITTNSSASILLTEGTKKYNLPVSTDDSGFSFVLPLRQYKTTIQETQIDSDLEQYQFVTKDIPLSGKVSTMSIVFTDPGDASETTWTEYNTLYLMDETTKGYVSRRTDTGRKLYFGNGLIGAQPTSGATLTVTVNETEGVNGNIIAGSIRSGERIYTSIESGANQLVSYTVINPSPAIDGEDEESLETIRINAINALTSLGRLVTNNDYKNIDVVVSNSPLASNSLAVLKRSDIKVNDIQLYTPLEFGSSIVPTRNTSHTVLESVTNIPRGTTITIDNVDYYTLFDLDLDALNSVANYNYIMYEIEQVPALVTSYAAASTYNIVATNLIVSKSGNKAVFELYYTSTETDYENCSCELQFSTSSTSNTMINDSTSSIFTFEFDPYTIIPEDNQTYYFTISNPSSAQVSRYSASLTFIKDCSDFMLSNIVDDGTSVIIYDIPVVKKSYYDGINRRNFELQVMQVIVSSINLIDYRMLTDFTNIKFTNTTGICENLKYNPTNRTAVISLVSSIPGSPNVGDRHIITSGTYKNNIAQCTDSTASIWIYVEPITDDIVNVTDLSLNYMYSENGWIPIPTYTIPLEIDIEIFKTSSYTSSNAELTTTIREAIVEAFEGRFGSNISLYRSEIIDVVQSITGVDHCRLIKPETSIFFNFELTNLTENELLLYGPEYIYFSESDIAVRII